MAHLSPLQRYGGYPVAKLFASNDHSLDTTESESMEPDKALYGNPTPKQHAACDECRKRKLKCSGEPLGCSRCFKQNIICHYSTQKQMGRPRKRQKVDEINLSEEPSATGTQTISVDPKVSAEIINRTNFENICNAPISQHIRRSAPFQAQYMYPSLSSQLSSGVDSQGSKNTSPYDAPQTPPDLDISNISYPTDVSLWPDFSDMVNLPIPVQESYEKDFSTLHNPGYTDPDANPAYLENLPAVPACPCLPNLYLTLSTLSTLSAFPISYQTIETLETAHRTARAVLYCPICPNGFQSCSQNVMLCSTLLTVLADKWLRICKASTEDLRKGFNTSWSNEFDSSLISPGGQDQEWHIFAQTLVRAYVFGGTIVPKPPSSSISFASSTSLNPNNIITLTSLVECMERRQRQWHSLDPHTTEFPPRLSKAQPHEPMLGMIMEGLKECEPDEKDMLCLKIVDHAKRVIYNLDREAPRVDGL